MSFVKPDKLQLNLKKNPTWVKIRFLLPLNLLYCVKKKILVGCYFQAVRAELSHAASPFSREHARPVITIFIPRQAKKQNVSELLKVGEHFSECHILRWCLTSSMSHL